MGPATEKARCCLRAVRARGTRSSPCVEERRALRPCTSKVERQSSCKYAGAEPKRHRQTKAESRYTIRCGIGSQCRTSFIKAVTWPNFGIWLMRRAAGRKTRSKHPTVQPGVQRRMHSKDQDA